MALPSSCENAIEYFTKVLRLSKHNQHLYNYPNTDVLIENVLEKINISDINKIDTFEKDFDIRSVLELKSTVEQVENFTSNHERRLYDVDTFDVPLAVKKMHEINCLSQEIYRNCHEYSCHTIVDLGCGLGYLDELLFKKYNYKILGLEHSKNFIKGAETRQKSYHRESIDNVKYIEHYVDDSSSVTIDNLLKEHFPESANVCVVGLHACADLTVHAINIFLKMDNAKCLILMPCCYHKMSLKSNADRKINSDTKSETQNAGKIREALHLHDDSEENDEFNRKKCQYFNNFPLSEELKSVYATESGSEYLKIPFLRLASQPSSTDEDLNTLVFRLIARAVLQLYCHKNNQRLVKRKRRAIKLISQTNDFSKYLKDAARGYSIQCNNKKCPSVSEENEASSNVKCKCNTEFNIEQLMSMWSDIWCDLTVKKAAILILLQRHLQPMFENLVLFDRIQFLKENGIENCQFIKIVDEKVSPRCLALVSVK